MFDRVLIVFALILVLAGQLAVGQPDAFGTSGKRVRSGLQNGPEYVAKAFTTKDGLPQNVIRRVERGLDGRLWIGSFDGLARYDGHSFERFNAAEIDGLVSNRITALHQAPDGVLWIGTETGLSIMQKGTFREIPALNMVDHLEGGPEGTVWIVARGEKHQSRLFHSTSDGVRTISLPDTLTDAHVADVAPTGRDSAWAVLGGDLFLWDGTTLTRPERVNEIAEEVTGPIESGSDDRLWIATESSLISVRGQTIRRRSIGSMQPWTMNIGPSGTLWVTMLNAGLFHVTGDSLRRIEADGLLSGGLYGLTRDESGQWWVGTQGNGLVRLRPRLFRAVEAGVPGQPAARGIYAEEDGTVWVGLEREGLLEFAGDRRILWTPSDGLPSAITWAIGRSRTGRLAAGTSGGLAWLENGQFTLDAQFPAIPVTALHRASTGALWMGTGVGTGGVYREQDGRITQVLPSRRLPARVNALHRDSSGSVWIGTRSKGLARLEGDSLTWYDTADGLPYVSVRDVYEAADGTIWVGTYGGGVARFEDPSARGPAFTAVTPEDGLPAGTINAIHEAPDGIFWMTSNEGVFRVPRAELAAVADGQRDRLYPRVFGPDDGMPDRECNGPFEPSIAEDAQGRLWIPTMKGPTVVDPSRDAFHVPESIPVRVAEVRADGTPVPLDSLRLAPSTYRVAIDFTGVSLRYGEDLSFRYRLDGGEWRPSRSRRTAEYTGLSPGTHRFEVQATVRGKTWHALDRPLALTVRPHFYQTWWFRLLVGVGLLGLGGSAYRWRTYRLRRRQEVLEATVEERTREIESQKEQLAEQAERLKELDEAKSRFFANLSHEFRTPLTLILGPAQNLRSRSERHLSEDATEMMRLIERNARRLLRLIEQILGIARMEAGTYQLAARPTDVRSAVDRITRTFEPLAEREDLTLTVEVRTAESGEERTPVYVDREALEHVVSNLLSNAIKFTPAGGRVEVEVRRRDDGAALTVSDTGPGIPPEKQQAIFDRFQQVDSTSTREQEGTGIGLAFVAELVDLHGGSVDLESTEGEGTAITVWFPAGSAHLPEEHVVDSQGEDPPIVTGGDGEGAASALFEPERAPDSPPVPATDGEGEEVSAGPETSKQVLVVDDNAEVRRYMRSILEPDFAVIEAASGQEGLKAARDELPDVILADVMMPEMDGHEMTRRLKGEPETEAIPIIMLTARAGTEEEVEGLEVGADDYVTKPFDAEVLRKRVEGVLTLQKRLRRWVRKELQREPDLHASSPFEEEQSSLVAEARHVIRDHLTDPDFDVDELARQMDVSRSLLYAKFDDHTEFTPGALIKEMRMEKATELLQNGEGSVTQVAYAVGYERLSTFSHAYKQYADKSPSAVLPDNE